MATPYNRGHNNIYPFSNVAVNLTLQANTALSWIVPGTAGVAYAAKFSVSSSADVWVRNNATAAAPISNTVTSTPNQERIDLGFTRYVNGGDVLSFISTGTPQVGVSLLELPNRQ